MKLLSILALLLVSTISFGQKLDLKFDHYAILVQDLEESANFYMEILGLKEIEDKTEQPHIRWFSLGKKMSLHVIEDKNHVQPDVKGVHLALRSKDLDGIIARLRAKNITFYNWLGMKNKTNARPDGIRQIYFQDPNGYWIEINGK
jgi:lactoylglutathione lyase